MFNAPAADPNDPIELENCETEMDRLLTRHRLDQNRINRLKPIVKELRTLDVALRAGLLSYRRAS